MPGMAIGFTELQKIMEIKSEVVKTEKVRFILMLKHGPL